MVRDEFGEIVRHKVSSTEYKGNDKPVRRTWIIDAKAADAIRVLERLLAVRSRYAGSEKSQLLFQQARRFGTSLGQTVNAGINSFVRHASTILQPRLLALQIPILENLEENVTTRTLRRTISWFIANRPFGVLAGMLQFGHISEVIFEGYAGSTAAGFRAEVDRDRVAARRRDIVEMYEASQRGERVAGPMAEALDVEFERVATVLADFPGKVVDEKRRMKMLEHLRVRLHPGLLADCFFEAEKARCLEHLDVDKRIEPIVGVCKPQCDNACWSKKHTTNWVQAIADVDHLSKRNRISPIQRKIIGKKKKEYQYILDQIRARSGHHD